MFVIGITGGIGCGKSSAANVCRKYGLEVIDADEISRDVTKAEGPAMPEIEQVFGKKVINADGSLNRKGVADLVFKNKKSLDVLSSIIHKYVIEEICSRIEKLKDKKCKAVVLDVPIPVKHGFLDVCDQVLVIWADDEIRIKRLNLRGMSTEDARRRILCQMPKEEYEKIATRVILNNDTPEDLAREVTGYLDEELHMRGIKM